MVLKSHYSYLTSTGIYHNSWVRVRLCNLYALLIYFIDRRFVYMCIYLNVLRTVMHLFTVK